MRDSPAPECYEDAKQALKNPNPLRFNQFEKKLRKHPFRTSSPRSCKLRDHSEGMQSEEVPWTDPEKPVATAPGQARHPRPTLVISPIPAMVPGTPDFRFHPQKPV